MRHCHLNNCAVGIATQEELLERRFKGKPEYVVNYFTFIVRELREIMAYLGVRTVDELIGRTELLKVDSDAIPWKAGDVDYSKILYKPEVPERIGTYCQSRQNHGIDKILDHKLIRLAEVALERCRWNLRGWFSVAA